jgi:hypothetical protein
MEQRTMIDELEVLTEGPHWVLVEGPGPGEAEFLGRWLLAAVDADKALAEQRTQNPGLKEQISRLEVEYQVSFSAAATRFVELLMKNLTCFTLDLWDEWGDVFTVMAGLGFFRQTGERHQMTPPQEINGPMIEDALLKLAATEDEDFFLQPEHLVSCLTKTEAHMWQDLLERQPWMERVADRALLLE